LRSIAPQQSGCAPHADPFAAVRQKLNTCVSLHDVPRTVEHAASFNR